MRVKKPTISSADQELLGRDIENVIMQCLLMRSFVSIILKLSEPLL